MANLSVSIGKSKEDKSAIQLPADVQSKSEEKSAAEQDNRSSENSLHPNSTNGNILDHSSRKLIIYNVDKFMKPKAMEKIVQGWIKDTDIKIERKKKPPKNNWIVLTLEHESMVGTLMNILNDGNHKNKKGGLLKAQRPTDVSDNNNRGLRRNGDDDNVNNRSTKRRRQSQPPVECVKTKDEVRDKLTPLWKMSYNEQLDAKTKMIVTKCLSKIVSEIKKKFQTLLKEQRKNNGSKKAVDSLYAWLKGKNAITLSPILAAPRTLKYRNKCELTFGYKHSHVCEGGIESNSNAIAVATNANVPSHKEDSTKAEADGNTNVEIDGDGSVIDQKKEKQIFKTPSVGFMAGGWAGGVSDPHCLSNIPDIVCGIADVVNNFLKTSPVPPYDAKTHRGVWRILTIRSSERTKQCMIVIVHAPASGGAGKRDDGSDDYTSVFKAEKQRLIRMMTEQIPLPARSYVDMDNTDTRIGDGEKQFCDTQVTSLFFQEFDGLSNPKPDHPVQHEHGNEFIEEKLLQCHFQISPGAFFQVTTEGAEKLYSVVVEKVKEVTPNPKDTLLFDVCCGTGTIGLTCMKEDAVGKVVGIDISEPAIRDAVLNAERNGYSGSDNVCRFIASRAEDVMHKEIQKIGKGCPMVAVVDPAREGLHQDVIKALRNQPELQRIVYVSCNPTGSLVKDAALLCSPSTKKYRGLPFQITSAQPVDMFPLTDHCEMVMVFDRMTENECSGSGQSERPNVKSEGKPKNEDKNASNPKKEESQSEPDSSDPNKEPMQVAVVNKVVEK